jgi:hypothetical protein
MRLVLLRPELYGCVLGQSPGGYETLELFLGNVRATRLVRANSSAHLSARVGVAPETLMSVAMLKRRRQ